MADTPFATAPATTEFAAGQRREIIIEAALDYMCAKGWYDVDEDGDDPEVIADVERLYADDLQPTPNTGSILADTGFTLALLWQAEQHARYQRSLPIWTCDCGAAYKRDQWAALLDVIYTVTLEGHFDEVVGCTKGKRGIGAVPRDDYAMNNGGCPSCGRAFAATITRQADPQTSLIL